jgi:hypothetical protein
MQRPEQLSNRSFNWRSRRAQFNSANTVVEAAPERGGPFATSTEKERSRLSCAQELPDFKPDRWVEGKLSGSPPRAPDAE